MASRYQKVTDVEKASQYYEAGLLYKLWPNLGFTGYDYVPYDSIYATNREDFIRHNTKAGHLYVLVEEDDNEEQPIG